MQKKRLTKKGQDPRSNKVSIYTSTYNSDLELLEEIRSNINLCCSVTMEPDEVEDLID